jgi:hypothetical protein
LSEPRRVVQLTGDSREARGSGGFRRPRAETPEHGRTAISPGDLVLTTGADQAANREFLRATATRMGPRRDYARPWVTPLRVQPASRSANRVRRTWHKTGDDLLRMVTHFLPVGLMQSLFETFCGLTAKGSCDRRCKPALSQTGASTAYGALTLSGGSPPFLQRLLFTLLRPILAIARLPGQLPTLRGDPRTR